MQLEPVASSSKRGVNEIKKTYPDDFNQCSDRRGLKNDAGSQYFSAEATGLSAVISGCFDNHSRRVGRILKNYVEIAVAFLPLLHNDTPEPISG